MSISEKVRLAATAIAIFGAVFAAIVFLAGRTTGRKAEKIQAAAFLAPAIILLSFGVLYPGVRSIYESFRNATGRKFIGFDNYSRIWETPELRIVLRNTVLWVVLVPLVATSIGLLYAVLVDKARAEAFAKSLIFLPMSISFVGASIIWKFVYDVRPKGREQIGVANQLITAVGGKPFNFILSDYNTLYLIVILVWIQAGFAMTILSAALKGIPDDVVEAAKLDGVNWRQMLTHITLPSLRPALVVVLSAIGIGTLKVFDIVRTMTGGQFKTNVVANEFFDQSFRQGDAGLGAALAVVLFVMVVPIIFYNVRQLRKADGR